MDISAAIAGRRSTREYMQQPLEEETILRLIRAATLAPSAMNRQPWTFTVVQNQDVLDRVSRDAKAHMVATMSADLAAGARAEHVRPMLSDPKFHIFYHAPDWVRPELLEHLGG